MMNFLRIFAVIVIMGSIVSSLTLTVHISAQSFNFSDIPRHPSGNLTLYGSEVLTRSQYLKRIYLVVEKLVKLQQSLDNMNSVAISSSLCNFSINDDLSSLDVSWIYVDPVPLLTPQNQRLLKALSLYVKHLSSLHVLLPKNGPSPDKLLLQSINALPLSEIENRLISLARSAKNSDMLSFEFNYMFLVAYYISLSSWGPGKYLCKSYITKISVPVYSSETGNVTSPLNSKAYKIVFEKIQYVPPKLLSCLKNWSVPPNSEVIRGSSVDQIIYNITQMLKGIIYYIPDYSMKFFIPAPFILFQSAAYLVPSNSTKAISNFTLGGSLKRPKGGPILNVTLSKNAEENFIDIKQLAKIAESIFSSMNSPQGSLFSSEQNLPILNKIPNSFVNLNVSSLTLNKFIMPNINAKMLSSFFMQMFLSKGTLKKMSTAGIKLAYIVKNRYIFSSLILLLGLLISKEMRIFNTLLFKRIKLDEKKLVSLCYNKLINEASRYVEQKSYYETPREFLTRSQSRLPIKLNKVLIKVTLLYEKVKYGNKRLNDEDKFLCINVLRAKRNDK